MSGECSSEGDHIVKRTHTAILAAPALILLGLCACSPPVPGVGIRLGPNGFERELMFEKAELNGIASLAWGRIDSDTVLVAAGSQGAVFLTREGRLRRFVSFDRTLARAAPVDVEGDGVFEFMGRGGGWRPVSLLDTMGRTIWEFSRIQSVVPDCMAAGDLDGDGLSEFVVGMNAKGGIHVYSDTGIEKARWNASNVFAIEIADINGDGRPEVIHSTRSDPRPGIWMRDTTGYVIRRIETDAVFFSLCQRPDSLGKTAILAADKKTNSYRMLDFEGRQLAEMDVRPIGYDPAGCPVRFRADQKPWFALSSSLSEKERRSLLAIFDPDGKCVYEEIFSTPDIAILPLRTGVDGSEELLVGSGTQIWKYVLK
jgi:hypothetical protein